MSRYFCHWCNNKIRNYFLVVITIGRWEKQGIWIVEKNICGNIIMHTQTFQVHRSALGSILVCIFYSRLYFRNEQITSNWEDHKLLEGEEHISKFYCWIWKIAWKVNFYLYGRKIKHALKCGITDYEAQHRKVYWVIINHKVYTSWQNDVKKKGKAQFWGIFVRKLYMCKDMAHSTKYFWSICWNNPSNFGYHT